MTFRETFSLQGKVALVTGGGGYLGSHISLGLAEAGAHVLVNGRSPPAVEHVVGLIQSKGLSAESAIFDITDTKAVERYFLCRTGLPLHAIVNNAYSGGAGTIESSGSESYKTSYHISVIAAHEQLKAALPLLRLAVSDTGYASVTNIASMYGLVSPDQRIYDSASKSNPPFYGAAKAALLQWTKYAACEFGPEGIRVNAISPGAFPSAAVQEEAPDFIKKLREKIPLGRVGSPSELKGPIVFLASNASSYINGANLVVDGGWTCW